MLISHDLGTSADKASLHADDGRILASANSAYPTRYGADTASEQNPEHWWQAVVAATRELLTGSDVRAGDVQGVCVSGQMMGAVLLDAAHRPVRPAMIWSDQRATAQAAQLSDAVGAAEAYRITGHRIAATYTLPKLMWVRDNEPEAWVATGSACVAKDYVNLRLTGHLATDHSDASSTDAYDLERGCWSAPILDAAGVDPALLPPVLASTDVLGTLRPATADELGLPLSTRVVVGGGDGLMASVGAGCVGPEDPGYVCLGTSAWYAETTAAPVLDPERRSFTYRHVVPGMYGPCATTQSGAGSLQWLAEALGEPGCPLDVGGLIAEARTARAADDDLFFLPYLLGERSPWWDPHASGVFVGLRRSHGRADMARAALEGVGFTLRLCIDAVVGSDNGRGVAVIGGGAASDFWLHMLADIWGVEVHRRTVTSQANALGAGVTALVGLGMADFGLARTLSRVEATFAPTAGHERHAAHLERFREVYTALAPWFDGAGGEAR